MDTGIACRLRGRLAERAYRLDNESSTVPILLQGRWMLQKAAAVYGITRCVSSRIQSTYGIDAREVATIHLPVNLEIFRPGPASPRFGGNPCLLFVGRMDDFGRNLGLLLEGFAIVRRRGAEAFLVLAGPTEDAARRR